MLKEKCAIIGFGQWGKKIVQNIRLSSLFEIEFIIDPLYEDKSYYGVRKCNDINHILLDNDIGTVFILTSNDLHFYYGGLFAKAGKNIFIEKPLCNTSKEANELLNICKKNNVKLMVGHNVIYYSIFKKVKKILMENKVGRIYHIEANRSRPIWKTIDKKSWRYRKKTCNGGPLIQMALHLIDTLQYYCDLHIKDLKVIGTNNYLKSENCEEYSIIGKIGDNITLYVHASYLPAETFYINIYGEYGTIKADAFNGLYFQKINEFENKKINFEINNPELDEIIDFYNFIKKEKNSYSKIEQAINDIEIVEEILEKNRSNCS